MNEKQDELYCCIFDYPTAEETWKNFSYDVIEKISNEVENGEIVRRCIVKCKKCGALFLEAYTHVDSSIYFSIKNDYCDEFYLVKDKEQALLYTEISKRSPHELLNILTSCLSIINFESDYEEGYIARWNGKEKY